MSKNQTRAKARGYQIFKESCSKLNPQQRFQLGFTIKLHTHRGGEKMSEPIGKGEVRSARMLAALGCLVVVLGIVLVVGLFVVKPMVQKSRLAATSSSKSYSESITLCYDSFVGYAPLVSTRFMQNLGDNHQLGVDLKPEDVVDYEARARALRSGDCDVAVMTIDADLVTGDLLDEFPGSIVLVLDETRGADGIVAFEAAVPNLSALDTPDGRIVATPDSPSETLARHGKSGMLPNMGKKWLIEADGAKDVLAQLKDADRTLPRGYALWEPQLSEALEIDGTHLIYSSADTTGVIVDVLVFNRAYLANHPDRARAVVMTYLQTLYSFESQQGGMVQMIMEHGRRTGDKFTEAQAQKMVDTIVWRNTLENYAHFGLLPRYETQGLQSMDTMIDQIAGVLVRTGKLDKHPAEGRTHELYYDAILRQLQAENFHPGGVGQGGEIRGQSELPALSNSEWDQLMVVGNLDATSIGFKRGTSDLSREGERDTDMISEQLRQYPSYYITVIGNARGGADPEASRRLAQTRADTVADRLKYIGVSQNRIRAIAATETVSGGRGQSVTFKLAQNPKSY